MGGAYGKGQVYRNNDIIGIVFSPASAALRIAPVADDTARLLNSRILAAAGIGFLFAVAANFFALAVENMRVYLVFYNLAGISVTLAAMESSGKSAGRWRMESAGGSQTPTAAVLPFRKS